MPTITKTIAKSGTRDFSTIQAAFTACLDDGNDYVLTIQDLSTYTEQAVLAARPSGGKVTLQANSFSRTNRPTLTCNQFLDGAILTLNATHYIKGIKFVYDAEVVGSAFRYCIKSNLAGIESEVSHCQFWMGQGYHYDDPLPIDEYGHVGYWAEYNTAKVKIWNNLFRGCAYAGVRYDPAAGNDIDIFHNTFVKCEECIWIESRVTGVQSIHDNIFDLDGTYSPYCWKMSAIYVNDNATPTQIGGLDYNLYYNRALGTRLPPMGSPTQLRAFLSWNTSYETRADLVAAHPTQEVNGYDHDPEFYKYCSDYHMTSTSFPLAKASSIETITDDNDKTTRPTDKAIGCYEVYSALPSNLESAAWRDPLENGHLYAKCTKGSGSFGKCKVTLDILRLV